MNWWLNSVTYLHASRDGIYCVLRAVAYNTNTDTLSASEPVTKFCKSSAIKSYESFNDYSVQEQAVLTNLLKQVLSDGVADMWRDIGLDGHYKRAECLDHVVVPAGNEVAIPDRFSPTQAREAVKAAFKEREWTIVSDDEAGIVAVYRKKSREARCTASFGDRKITLASEGYKVKDDGTKEKTTVNDRSVNDRPTALVTSITLPYLDRRLGEGV